MNRAILAGAYKVPVTLQQRRDRHTGEEAWTIMTMDGAECMSSGVHILGFFVGHMGYNSHTRTTNEKRKDYADYGQNAKTLLPCFMKAK